MVVGGGKPGLPTDMRAGLEPLDQRRLAKRRRTPPLPPSETVTHSPVRFAGAPHDAGALRADSAGSTSTSRSVPCSLGLDQIHQGLYSADLTDLCPMPPAVCCAWLGKSGTSIPPSSRGARCVIGCRRPSGTHRAVDPVGAQHRHRLVKPGEHGCRVSPSIALTRNAWRASGVLC